MPTSSPYQPAPPADLARFLVACRASLTRYVQLLAHLTVDGVVVPRRMVFAYSADTDEWSVRGLSAAHPDFEPEGMPGIRQQMTQPYQDLPTVHVLINVQSSARYPLMGTVLVTNTAGECVAALVEQDSDWHELEADKLGLILRYPGKSESDDNESRSPAYRPTRQRMRRILQEMLPDAGDCVAAAERCMQEAQAYAQAQVDSLIYEAQEGVEALMKAAWGQAETMAGVIERAKKAQDKQYQRLFKDYEKVQMQARGYQLRIQRLEGEVKKLGQRKLTPDQLVAETQGTLASRLDALF